MTYVVGRKMLVESLGPTFYHRQRELRAVMKLGTLLLPKIRRDLHGTTPKTITDTDSSVALGPTGEAWLFSTTRMAPAKTSYLVFPRLSSRAHRHTNITSRLSLTPYRIFKSAALFTREMLAS
ncbi:hypothetical protein PSPO01_09644 [Paraphaeosphaeria sporulosa]